MVFWLLVSARSQLKTNMIEKQVAGTTWKLIAKRCEGSLLHRWSSQLFALCARRNAFHSCHDFGLKSCTQNDGFSKNQGWKRNAKQIKPSELFPSSDRVAPSPARPRELKKKRQKTTFNWFNVCLTLSTFCQLCFRSACESLERSQDLALPAHNRGRLPSHSNRAEEDPRTIRRSKRGVSTQTWTPTEHEIHSGSDAPPSKSLTNVVTRVTREKEVGTGPFIRPLFDEPYERVRITFFLPLLSKGLVKKNWPAWWLVSSTEMDGNQFPPAKRRSLTKDLIPAFLGEMNLMTRNG